MFTILVKMTGTDKVMNPHHIGGDSPDIGILINLAIWIGILHVCVCVG